MKFSRDRGTGSICVVIGVLVAYIIAVYTSDSILLRMGRYYRICGCNVAAWFRSTNFGYAYDYVYDVRKRKQRTDLAVPSICSHCYRNHLCRFFGFIKP